MQTRLPWGKHNSTYYLYRDALKQFQNNQPSLQTIHFTAQALQGLVYATFTLGQDHLPRV